MSTLKVAGIRGTGASADAVTLHASDGTCTAKITNTSNNTRLNLNGAFNVWQRGTSSTGKTSGFRIADRWSTSMGSLGTWTGERSTDVPTNQGFGHSFKLDCTTADASPASADYLYVHYTGEGQDVQHLKFGGSNAESVTVSFWVKCTKTGNFQVNFVQVESTERILGKTVTISSANTWEKKTLTFAGDTGGAGFTNDNAARWRIEMWLDRGSNYSSGALPTSWETMAAVDRGATTTLALGDNTANDFYITGIQVEANGFASDFQHRSYGDELALCQRYYQQYYYGQNSAGDHTVLMNAHSWSTSQIYGSVQFPVRMRSTPTGDITNGTDYWCAYETTPTTDNFDTMSVWNASENAAILKGTDNLSVTAGQGVFVVGANAAARLAFSSEL